MPRRRPGWDERVQVTLTRRGDYAVRSVLAVARQYGRRRVKAAEIASEMAIPPLYLPQILALLVREGLLDGMAGREGGYTLAMPPVELSLLRVVEAAEGPIELEACVLRGGPCDWEHACPLHEHWSDAQRVLRQRLAQATFADLVAADAEIAAGRASAEPTHVRQTPRRGMRPQD